MSDARIIKRYANRKLYDTQHSRYVTLDQIAEMIRNGDDVKIIDNKSKDDLTSVTLAQIIFEEEKKQKSFLPLQAMRNIIQSGGESITQFVSQAQRRATGLFKKDGEEGEEGEGEVEEGGAESELREWIAVSQRRIDVWQKKLDSRIRNVVDGVTTPLSNLQRDLMSLRKRILDLESKLRSRSDTDDGTGRS